VLSSGKAISGVKAVTVTKIERSLLGHACS